MTDRRTQLLDAAIVVIARRGVRGLRVQEVAAEAGVSVPLLYHYFGSREGLLEAALFAVSEHADRYSTSLATGTSTAREELVARLVGELQDTEEVRTNSSAWGELRWNSVFEEELRPAVHKLTAEWVDEIADLIEKIGVEEGRRVARDSHASAERLVALVEGLSGRWLTGAVGIDRLRGLLRDAIDLEVGSGSD